VSGSSGVDEMDKTYELLRERVRAGVRSESVAPKFTGADRRLLVRAPSGIPGVEVWSLSPSDAAGQLFLQEIAEWARPSREAKRRLVAQEPNTLASVVWIDFGGRCALLGSDLETSKNPNLGWRAILDSAARPNGLARVFKVAHHGSETGNEKDVWTQMLQTPISMLTPFSSSNLPTNADKRRIAALSHEAYVSAKPERRIVAPRDAAVAKTLREGGKRIWKRVWRMGQIRVRWAIDGAPRAEIFGTATRL
jgi:hypothetical protein